MYQFRSKHDDPTLASRYECKYLVSPLVASSLRQFLSPFMQPDPYAAACEGYRYPISSLYLDSDDLALYRQTVGGEKNRFKLRIRSYSDDPSTPLFFEVKRKIDAIVKKRRAGLARTAAAALLAGDPDRSALDALDPDTAANLEFFDHHARMIGAKPVLRVRYQREAYESKGGDPVRVTLDTDLQHAVTLDGDTRVEAGRWVTTPVDGVILEIKFTAAYPSWIRDLVRSFGLKQRPVPKYILSVDHMIDSGRETSLAVAGFLLPPRRIGQ